MLRAFFEDLGYALRGIRRHPLFAATTVLALSIAIGGNLAVFSAAEGLVLEPLPLPDLGRLALVWGASPKLGRGRDVVSGPNFLDFKERSVHFEGLAAYKSGADSVIVEGKGVAISGLVASPDFFRVLGVEPALGRLFQPQDGWEGRTGVAVLSHAFWQSHFGGDPNIIGNRVRMMGRFVDIIGILPERFRFLRQFDLVEPLNLDQLRQQGRMSITYYLVGRLAPSVSFRQAEEGLNAILQGISRQDPRMVDWVVRVDPLAEAMSEYIRPALSLLLAAGGLTLLIACVNVSGLLMARGLKRRPELALRAALGASRGRLIRLLAAESFVLALAGGLGGLLLAGWLLQLAPTVMPESVPIPGSAAAVHLPEISMGGMSMALTLPLTLVATILFAAVPTLQASRPRLGGWLSSGGSRALSSSEGRRSQSLVVLAEMALTAALLTGTGLAVRSAFNLLTVDPGLNPAGLLTLYFGELNQQGSVERAAYYRRVLEATAGVPGVGEVGLNDYVPLQQEDDFEGFHFEGIPPQGVRRREEWRRVSAGYFRAAGIPLIEGRTMREQDDERAPSVAVINQAMAEKHWPGESPVGRRIVLHHRSYLRTEIVGVVGNVKRRGLDQDPPPVIYVPYQRSPRPIMALFVRSPSQLQSLIEPLKQAIHSVDPLQPVMGVRRMDQVVSHSVALQRSAALLLGAVASLALALAALGIYGAMTQSAELRVREMGIRIALGAAGWDILNKMLGTGIALSLAGAAIGTGASILLAQGITPFLYQVEPLDPLSCLATAVLIACVALLACLRPARWLSRVDPITVLRSE